MPRPHPIRRHRLSRSRQTCVGAERTPLELAAWLEARYRALIDAEEAKGARGNPARVDAALQAIAGLVRTAAPYRHARIKPVERDTIDNVRQIIELCWAGERSGAPAAGTPDRLAAEGQPHRAA